MSASATTTMDYDRYDTLRPIEWRGDRLRLLDQRLLPQQVDYIDCVDHEAVAAAIHSLAVRGAPAIGIAGAYGLVLAAQRCVAQGHRDLDGLKAAASQLVAARPTAVNLAWAVARMMAPALAHGRIDVDELTAMARAIETEDLAANRRMGELGAALIEPGGGVLTHCNTGSLATAGFGTALGVIRAAWAQGRLSEVFATET